MGNSIGIYKYGDYMGIIVGIHSPTLPSALVSRGPSSISSISLSLSRTIFLILFFPFYSAVSLPYPAAHCRDSLQTILHLKHLKARLLPAYLNQTCPTATRDYPSALSIDLKPNLSLLRPAMWNLDINASEQ